MRTMGWIGGLALGLAGCSSGDNMRGMERDVASLDAHVEEIRTETEAHEMLRVMKDLAGAGLGILFITHRLDEILAVSSHITVLRDGELRFRIRVGKRESMAGNTAHAIHPHVFLQSGKRLRAVSQNPRLRGCGTRTLRVPERVGAARKGWPGLSR